MTPEDQQKIRTWASQTALSGCPMALNAHGGPAAELIKDFVQELKELAPELTIRRNPEDAFCAGLLIARSVAPPRRFNLSTAA